MEFVRLDNNQAAPEMAVEEGLARDKVVGASLDWATEKEEREKYEKCWYGNRDGKAKK